MKCYICLGQWLQSGRDNFYLPKPATFTVDGTTMCDEHAVEAYWNA